MVLNKLYYVIDFIWKVYQEGVRGSFWEREEEKREGGSVFYLGDDACVKGYSKNIICINFLSDKYIFL